MKKYKLKCDILSGTLTTIIEAENMNEAEEKFDKLNLNEQIKKIDRRLKVYKIELLCDICSQPEDADGRCRCTNKDAL